MITACLIGVPAFLFLLLPLWRVSFPSPPSRITIEVTFPRGAPGQCEPLIVTGHHGDGDIFAIRYLDEQTAVFVYDVWGVGGPTSRPFALRPGERRALEVEMPTLVPIKESQSHEKRQLRIALDREVLLDEPTFFHPRRPEEIFFGTNPIGGTVTSQNFRGQLVTAGPRSLLGGPECLFSPAERLRAMLRMHAVGLLLRVAASIAIGFFAGWILTEFVPWLANRLLPDLQPKAPHAKADAIHTQPPHAWFLGAATVCTLAFAAVMTSGTFRFLVPDQFGDFYDYQAASLLRGRLDLPEAARTSESFIFEGRIYMYFGPTPAVLRLPFAATKVAFGQLSRCYMLAYYVMILAAIYALLVHVARIAGGNTSWPRASSTVWFTATSGLGTTLFFLGSRIYVFHEAILCGAAFALWSGYCSLRYLAAPERPWWLGALICGILAIQARPTTGLFALSVLGAAALLLAGQNRPAKGHTSTLASEPDLALASNLGKRHVTIAVLGALGVFSFSAVSYLKFKTFEGAPLKYHVEYTPERLAAFEGKNFHFSNLWFNFDTYFGHAHLAIRPGFPYVDFARSVVRGGSPLYPRAKFDLAEPVIAMPYTMPAMLLLALAGGAVAFAVSPAFRAPLAVVAAGAAPMVLALLTAVAVSERYIADFCPPLILAGSFGLQAFELLPSKRRRIAAAFFAILAAYSITVTSLITVHYQGAMVWGVPDPVRQNYQALRTRMDALFGTGSSR